MEYVVGSFLTLAILVVASRLFKVNELAKPIKIRSMFNQTRKYELIRNVMPFMPIERPQRITQSLKHRSDLTTKILFIDDKAYWIENGRLTEAVTDNGMVDMETQKEVDIMAMDNVQLKKMQFVVEKLTEGKINDSGNSGHKGL